jgi:hypothetical protein
MYAIQLAQNAWLHPTLGVTTSMRHAMLYASQPTAEEALAAFTGDREPALALSCLTPRQRAYYRTAPVALVLASELQARAAQANGKHGEDQAAKRPTPVAEKPARNAGSGVTRAIYQWTLDNPSATKADALQAFPSANPSTVSVQFGAARRARQ